MFFGNPAQHGLFPALNDIDAQMVPVQRIEA
jgi:hypothetical protein